MKIEIKYKCDFETIQEEEEFLRTLANRHDYKTALWDFSQLWRKFKYDEELLTLDSLKEEIGKIFEDNNININELD